MLNLSSKELLKPIWIVTTHYNNYKHVKTQHSTLYWIYPLVKSTSARRMRRNELAIAASTPTKSNSNSSSFSLIISTRTPCIKYSRDYEFISFVIHKPVLLSYVILHHNTATFTHYFHITMFFCYTHPAIFTQPYRCWCTFTAIIIKLSYLNWPLWTC